MSASSYLSGFAGLPRRVADRISPDTAPCCIGYSFTFEHREGIRFRDDGRGCQLWYLGEDDHRRAHSEADTEHVIVDWRTMRARFGR